MLDRTRRNHLAGAVAVLILTQVSAVSGNADLLLARCSSRVAAGFYLQNISFSCPGQVGFQVSPYRRCETNESLVKCNLREGINTILVLADESDCTINSISILDHSPVRLNKTIRPARFCRRSFKAGHFQVTSNRTQTVSFRWSLPEHGQCGPNFRVAC